MLNSELTQLRKTTRKPSSERRPFASCCRGTAWASLRVIDPSRNYKLDLFAIREAALVWFHLFSINRAFFWARCVVCLFLSTAYRFCFFMMFSFMDNNIWATFKLPKSIEFLCTHLAFQLATIYTNQSHFFEARFTTFELDSFSYLTRCLWVWFISFKMLWITLTSFGYCIWVSEPNVNHIK